MGKPTRNRVLVVHCACGDVMRGTKGEPVLIVHKHALESHNMKTTREEVLSRARPES